MPLNYSLQFLLHTPYLFQSSIEPFFFHNSGLVKTTTHMNQNYPLKNFISAGFKKAMAFLIFLNLLSFAALAQPGKDGAITITTANTVVNRYTRVTADVLAGSNTVTVNSITELNRDAIGYLPGGYVTNATVYASNAIGWAI